MKKFSLNGELLKEWRVRDFFAKRTETDGYPRYDRITVAGDGNNFAIGDYTKGTKDVPIVVGFNQEGEIFGRWEVCRDEEGNIKEITDYGILAVEPWGEGQYRAYIGDEIYLLER